MLELQFSAPIHGWDCLKILNFGEQYPILCWRCKMYPDTTVFETSTNTETLILGVAPKKTRSTEPVDAEVALYLGTLCKHLQTEAQAKGSDAGMTSGTEAAVYASEASDSNDLLDKILPESVSDYVKLIKTHIDAGQTNLFIARQLLLLAAMLDFSDATNTKVDAVFVLQLLNSPLQHEVDEDGNKVVIGDGISLGGERDWADAVFGLAKKIHSTQGWTFMQLLFKTAACPVTIQ